MNTLFERSVNYKDEWLTPPTLIKALGEFDLDPCSPVNRPWDTAKKHFTVNDDGLLQKWEGRVFCNPPYSQVGHWLKKSTYYGNTIALIFARTDTNEFFKYVWAKANGLLFIKQRVKFYTVDGTKGKTGSGAPSVLISWDAENSYVLKHCSIPGKFIPL